jgi:hypothetical protein
MGSLLGQAASFASITLPIGGFDQPLLIFVVAFGATGATVVVAGVGEVWADLSGRFSRPAGNWLPAVVLSAALFSVVFWASAQLRTVLEFGSWSLISAGVWAVLATPTVGVLATALAVAAGWALCAGNASGRVPAWLLGPGADLCWSRPAPRPGQAVMAGVASGAAGAAVIIGFRLMAGPAAGPTEQEQRYHTYLWLAAVVGVVTALLLALTNGGRGRGAALLAGPIAAATVGVGFLAENTALGGALTLDFGFRVVEPGVALSFLLYVATAELTLLALPPVQARAPTALVVTIAAVLATSAGLAVVGGRDALVPRFDEQTATQLMHAATTELAIYSYKTRIGPDLFTRHVQLDKKASRINADPGLTPADRVARYRGEILAPLRDMLATAESYLPPEDRVAKVHQHCVAALRLRVTANENLVLSMEPNNQVLLDRGQTALQAESQEWKTWLNELSHL